MAPTKAAWSFYAYNPSFILPIVCIVLFFLAFIAHTFIMIRKKAWYVSPFLSLPPSRRADLRC